MYYSNYLIHYNQNHSKANGQFTFGDGDGDGIRDDHHHYSKNKGDLRGASNKKPMTREQKKKIALGVTGGILAAGATAAGIAAIVTSVRNRSSNDTKLLTSGSKLLSAGQTYTTTFRKAPYTEILSGDQYSEIRERLSNIKSVGGDW